MRKVRYCEVAHFHYFYAIFYENYAYYLKILLTLRHKFLIQTVML